LKQFVVIGNPISHSKSPLIHQLFAQQFDHELDYQTLLTDKEAFRYTVLQLQQKGYTGCNITLPFKELAFEVATQFTERANLAGAVNTLHFKENGILADNTDGQGLVEDIMRQTGSLKGKKVLLLGAGGAAKGSVFPLLQAGVSEVGIYNRTHSKAEQLERTFEQYGMVRALRKSQLREFGAIIIVNSTSSSVKNEIPDIPSEAFSDAQLAYDMFYSENSTSFEQFAKQSNMNLKTCDGIGMLIGQAAESYSLWWGVKPDIDAVIRQLAN